MRRRPIVLAAIAVLGATAVLAGAGHLRRLRAPRDVSRARAKWPLPGRDYASSRAVRRARITRRNVGRLEVAMREYAAACATFDPDHAKRHTRRFWGVGPAWIHGGTTYETRPPAPVWGWPVPA